jgi:hypothetical protein
VQVAEREPANDPHDGDVVAEADRLGGRYRTVLRRIATVPVRSTTYAVPAGQPLVTSTGSPLSERVAARVGPDCATSTGLLDRGGLLDLRQCAPAERVAEGHGRRRSGRLHRGARVDVGQFRQAEPRMALLYERAHRPPQPGVEPSTPSEPSTGSRCRGAPSSEGGSFPDVLHGTEIVMGAGRRRDVGQRHVQWLTAPPVKCWLGRCLHPETEGLPA